jgi:hypothetical protein
MNTLHMCLYGHHRQLCNLKRVQQSTMMIFRCILSVLRLLQMSQEALAEAGAEPGSCPYYSGMHIRTYFMWIHMYVHPKSCTEALAGGAGCLSIYDLAELVNRSLAHSCRARSVERRDDE